MFLNSELPGRLPEPPKSTYGPPLAPPISYQGPLPPPIVNKAIKKRLVPNKGLRPRKFKFKPTINFSQQLPKRIQRRFMDFQRRPKMTIPFIKIELKKEE